MWYLQKEGHITARVKKGLFTEKKKYVRSVTHHTTMQKIPADLYPYLCNYRGDELQLLNEGGCLLNRKGKNLQFMQI